MSWFCARTKVKSEFAVENRLEQAGFEAYCPRVLADQRLNPRHAVEPAFCGYVFLYIREGEDDLRPAKKTPGLVEIVSLNSDSNGDRHPSPVPEGLIASLKALEDDQGVHVVKHDYAPGERARIRTGPFAGLEAVIQKTTPKKRVYALFEFMGKLQRMKFDYSELEPVA